MTDEMPFGHALREKRTDAGISLRKFAESLGVSPTYLSQVEQCNVMPPTAERAKHIAQLLGENPDKWILLAGHVPEDLLEIIRAHPVEISALLRVIGNFTSEEITQLRIGLRPNASDPGDQID